MNDESEIRCGRSRPVVTTEGAQQGSSDDLPPPLLGPNEFLDQFELVLNNDWDMAKSRVTDEYMIDPEIGTFLEPCLEDESNHWVTAVPATSSV
ncbi:hypothetical protein [Nocardia brasiliensis]|uniref:hypothetical protein n=1 Tax=Nocardia brasiliensis TaxID=37326 RepID=UPI0024555821|nr:hypothetical protein [Nocardia brasiliensis]